MTILVTGGTGLVGSRLLRKFAETGIECRGLVRSGKQLPAGITRAEGDLFDAASLERSVQGVDAIIHLAAVFRTRDESEIWRANLEGTRNLIAAAKTNAPNARFIMASTALVYSEDVRRPGRESDDVYPKLAYPASKIAAEKELRESGLNWSILRLPFVYGDGDEHLVSIQRHPSVMKMHPAQTFSMAHQRDVIAAFQLALTGAMDGKVVNICDDAPTSLYEMARIIGLEIEGSAEPLTNPWMGRVDGSLARSLGFRPTIFTVYQAASEGIL
jgi:UDP-glucose 4-epimerase